jgi:hypothetical protein
MRDGENKRNEGDAFNPTHPDQPDQSASPYLKHGRFGGFNFGRGLDFFKPTGLMSSGQKGQNSSEPTYAHP